MKDAQSLAVQIARLPDLPMEKLWALWDQHFPRRPAHHNRHYVTARVAYKLQEQAHGGLATTTRKRLEKIGEAQSRKRLKRGPELHLAPGTLLLREFNDIEYRVKVNSDGHYDWNGQTFKTLSAVARAITGTPWSGPKFFGLRKDRRP